MPVIPGLCSDECGSGGGGGGTALRVTRSAAIALRDTASVPTCCPIVITDGPTIGVAGNQSTTEIVLQGASAGQFSLGALVVSGFANSAWVGTYDIDAGVLFSLEDDRGNTVRDDQNGDLVQTQFPWGFNHVTGNRVSNTLDGGDVSLPGWGLAANAGTIDPRSSFGRFGLVLRHLRASQPQHRSPGPVLGDHPGTVHQDSDDQQRQHLVQRRVRQHHLRSASGSPVD